MVYSLSVVATAMNDDRHLRDVLLHSEGVITFGIVVKCAVIAAAITGAVVIAARFVPL